MSGDNILREWHNIYTRVQKLAHQQGNKHGNDKHKKGPQDDAELSLVLDQLNSLNFPIPVISREEILSTVVAICNSLQPSQSIQNGAKFCKLLQTLSRSQLLALKQPQLDVVLNLLIMFINNPWALPLRLDALRCLSYVIFECGPLCVTKHQTLLDILMPMCAAQEPRGANAIDKETRRMAINCVGNLCVKCGAKMSKFYPPIFDMLYSIFVRHGVDVQKDASLAKGLCSTMRALQFVMQEAKTVHEPRISPFLNELKRLSFFGTPLALPPTLPTSQSSSSISSASSSTSDGPAKKPTRKNKKKPATSHGDDEDEPSFNIPHPKPDLPIYMSEHKAYSSSESEFGEDDDRFVFWKIRYHALMCVHVICRLGPPKLFYQYYPLFVPSSPHPLNYSLFTNIFNDPSAKVRVAALSVLAAIIDSSRSFMLALPLPSAASPKMTKAASTSSVPHSSYTPVSQTLSGMVREIHNGLIATMDSEQSTLVLLHTVKCVSVLVSVAPYEKMPAGLLSSLISRIYSCMPNKDTQIRSATLSCLSCFFSTRVAHPEVAHALSPLLTSTPPSSPMNPPSAPNFAALPPPTSPTSTPLAPLLEALLRIASSQEPLPNIRAEALHVLGSLSKNYFDILCGAWDRALQLVVLGLKDSEGIVRFHSAKFLEDFTKALLELETNAVPTKLDGRTVWDQLLQGDISPIISAIGDTSPQVRASVCTTFSHISPKAAEALEMGQRITVLSTLSGLTGDEQPTVRAAAARTVGVYILIPVFREDASFVCDAATQLVAAMDDSNLNVKIRACWSLANLCDSLVALQDSQVLEDIPVSIIITVCVSCLKATHENDKIKCNAVRALGNFARFAPHVLLCHSPAASQSPNTPNTPNTTTTPKTLLCRIALSLLDSLLATDSTTNGNNNNAKPPNANSNNPNAAGSSAVKVRWNACYAIGNLLRNQDAFQDDSSGWLPQVSWKFSRITKMGKNFKIRINAAVALAVIAKREHYGAHFCDIVHAAVEGLENMEEIEDFSEFKYKENLHVQLGTTLAHLLQLATPSDLENLTNLLNAKESVIGSALDFLQTKQTTLPLADVFGTLSSFYERKEHKDVAAQYQKRISQLNEPSNKEPS